MGIIGFCQTRPANGCLQGQGGLEPPPSALSGDHLPDFLETTSPVMVTVLAALVTGPAEDPLFKRKSIMWNLKHEAAPIAAARLISCISAAGPVSQANPCSDGPEGLQRTSWTFLFQLLLPLICCRLCPSLVPRWWKELQALSEEPPSAPSNTPKDTALLRALVLFLFSPSLLLISLFPPSAALLCSWSCSVPS